MKTAKVLLALLLLGAILGAASSSYAYSTKLYVQGRLTTAAGVYLPTGTYPITFKIYVSETAKTPLWYDTFTAVKVSAGIFAVTLGSQKALTSTSLLPDKPTLPTRVSVCSSDKRWLEVVVAGEVFGPRVKLNTAAYAANADTLDVLDSTKFSLTTHTHSLQKLTGTLLNTQIPATITRDTEVFGLVKAKAGPGSGLNADLLDGKHAADLITAVRTPSGSGLSGGAGSGNVSLAIAAGGVVGPMLANLAVTTPKVANAAVTTPKVADAAVTTPKVANAAVTNQKVSPAGSASGQVLTSTGTAVAWQTPSTNADTVDGKHAADFAAAVHTHAFAAITGSLADGQIPASITRDTELAAGLATKANAVHTHDDRYYTKAEVDVLKNQIAALQTAVNELTARLQNVSKNGTDLTFSGVNVRIVNGSDNTETSNGLGNLIVGYNEMRNDGNDNRTGSHSIVVGKNNTYSSYGGLVAGLHNTASAPFASVSGGCGNIASGENASVSGGGNNEASGQYASVSGGVYNTASFWSASVSGGYGNLASGMTASVSGGAGNKASGDDASVSGGMYNQAVGDYSFVGGGGHRKSQYGNVAYANLSAVLGGTYNITGVSTDATVAELSTVSGGDTNQATGWASCVSGGSHNSSTATCSAVGGGHYLTVSTNYGFGP